MSDAPFLGVRSSLSGRLWRSRLEDERQALALSQRWALPDIMGRILAARGITVETADRFLNPALKTDLPDPAIFQDMETAAQRLAAAVMGGEAVAVFGDYDVDGATSAALLKRFFAAVGSDATVYIPDRLNEGYGPNEPALMALRQEGIGVVITVDCGTLSYGPLAAAKAAGMDVIVVDHHQAQPKLPECYALVNPNRLDEPPGHGQLAAVGVAFLLVIAVNRALRTAGWYGGERPEPDLTAWLDLVALGTVCDVVPLTGLNRTLVTRGLKVMAGRRNIGLKALADTAGLDEPPAAYHLGFVLGPRINAGGRVGEADLGVRLLTAEDPAEAESIARRLHEYNRERQAIESMVLDAARMEAERQAGAPLIVAVGEGWHPGVIGIVAGRLKEQYRRPVIVIGVGDGIGKGSGRSITGIDLGAAVTAARQADLLIDGGGHAMAAGMTVAADRIDALTAFLSERLAGPVAERMAADSLGIDGAVSVRAATGDLLDVVEKAAPFGAGNAEPRFAVANSEIIKADVVGEDHIRLIIAGSDGGRLKAMAFRALSTPMGQVLLSGRGRFHFAGALKRNRWNGTERIEMIIHDAAQAKHKPQ